jgi:hypothetical protein
VRVRLADLEPSPDVFAAVMATGILSVAAAQHEYRQISEMRTEIGQRSLLTVSLVFFWDALAARLIVTLAGLLLACPCVG